MTAAARERLEVMQDYEGRLFQDSVEVGEKPVRLEFSEVTGFVRLMNPRYLEDEVTPNNVEIFWGTVGSQKHLLLPSTDTDLLPLSRASQIWLRTRRGSGEAVLITYEVYR